MNPGGIFPRVYPLNIQVIDMMMRRCNMSITKKNMTFALFAALLLAAALFFTGSMQLHAEDFKCKDAGNSLTYNASNCPGTAIYTATKPIKTAKSSDEKVFKVNTGIPYVIFTEQHPESEYYDLADDGQCEIIPMGPGTATLTLTDDNNNTITETIKVEENYFAAYLNSDKSFENQFPVGLYYSKLDYSGEEYAYTLKELMYGDTRPLVYSRYGTKITLTLKGKKYKGTTNTEHLCLLTGVKSVCKLGTKGTLTFEFGPATVTKKIKIASDTHIVPDYIKAKAKKGKVVIRNLHKGDVVTIKAGKKTVKTIKVKKNIYKKIYSFTTAKKMKKGTKIKYTVKNKFKQVMAKTTYKVGSEAPEY